ncbi:MAG: hypothetical protein ABIO70_06285 [Pseudomonadota bacterium]
MEPSDEHPRPPRRWHAGALGAALALDVAAIVLMLRPWDTDGPALGLLLACAGGVALGVACSLVIVVLHVAAVSLGARTWLRWALYPLPLALFMAVSWLLAPEPAPNQRPASLSSGGGFVAEVDYRGPHWQITIRNDAGEVVHQEAPEELWVNFSAYWTWDMEERFWLYNSDDGSVWVWERRGEEWVWGRWEEDGCDLNAPRPPGVLWPPNAQGKQAPECAWSAQAVPLDAPALATAFTAALVEHGVMPAEQVALAALSQQEAARLAMVLGAVDDLEPERLHVVLLAWIVDNLQTKLALRPPLFLDADTIARTVVHWEAFRLERYITNGAAPKRYFGYFDGRGDTAARERVLMDTTRCATGVVNAWQAEQGDPLRIHDAEVAVTFLAEGGALLLGPLVNLADDLHPVHDLGMDDIAHVMRAEPALVARLDSTCGTALAETVIYGERGWFGLREPDAPPEEVIGRLDEVDGRWAWLARPLTFEEGVVGTALMWRWEKARAAADLIAGGRAPLHTRSPAAQLVVGSLVYNSGLVHDETTIEALLAGEAGSLLWERSDANAHRRPRLPLLPPRAQLSQVLRTAEVREQPTSWLAAYHVAQRCGAWEALMELTDTFDANGDLRAAPEEPP